MIGTRLIPSILVALCIAIAVPADSQPNTSHKKTTVIIDAGHGGADLGARSSRSVLEKNITLKLARFIKAKLSVHKNLTIIMTRTGDKEIPLIERIESANFNKGDIFVSIHTGGGKNKRAFSRKIYIYNAGSSKADSKTEKQWGKLNGKYSDKNIQLASSISGKLTESEPKRKVDIVQSPLLAIKGADMPTAIIEPIDLANPNDEIRLEKDEYLQNISGAIAIGIKSFIDKQE